jgi:hypothetical protein
VAVNPWLEAALSLFGLQHFAPYIQDIFEDLGTQPGINRNDEIFGQIEGILSDIGEEKASSQALYFPFHAEARRAWRSVGGFEYSPFLSRVANRLADINPSVLYGLYNVEDTAPQEEEMAAWYQGFIRGTLGVPAGQAPSVTPVQTPREMAALMAANLAPGSETYFAKMLREAVRTGDHFQQFMLLRDALQAAMFDVVAVMYQPFVLNALGDLYERYLIDLSDGKIPREMSFIEYTAVYGADRIGDWFPGLRWDQLDDLWAAWRAQEAGKAQEQVPMEQPVTPPTQVTPVPSRSGGGASRVH